MIRFVAKVILKRQDKAEDKIVIDGLIIDTDAHMLSVDGKRVDLANKEYELLLYLARNENMAVTREQLLEKVWGYDYYGDDRTLDTHMKSLRKKIGRYSDNIITIRRVGYRFEAK